MPVTKKSEHLEENIIELKDSDFSIVLDFLEDDAIIFKEDEDEEEKQ